MSKAHTFISVKRPHPLSPLPTLQLRGILLLSINATSRYRYCYDDIFVNIYFKVLFLQLDDEKGIKDGRYCH